MLSPLHYKIRDKLGEIEHNWLKPSEEVNGNKGTYDKLCCLTVYKCSAVLHCTLLNCPVTASSYNQLSFSSEEFVQQTLERMLASELKGITDDIFYSGSNYELTEVPGPSDYDIQYFIKTGRPGDCKPMVEDCGINGWKKIKGGPKEWLTEDGYLSPYKVSKKIIKLCALKSSVRIAQFSL